MKLVPSVVKAFGTMLSAFVPTGDSAQVVPLPGGRKPEQRVVQAGLSQTLASEAEFERFGRQSADRSFHSYIKYFEVVLSYGPVADPTTVFLLVNSYLVANQQKYGIAFFERLFKRYENSWDDQTRASYLAAYAILRATYAERVPVPGRIGWVTNTFDILDEARGLAQGENPLVRWSAGLIYAQVPGVFGKHDDALRELNWLAEHPESEPIPGFYREVYHHLAKIHAADGNAVLAEKFLKKCGYDEYKPAALFMGWYTTTRKKGLTFAATPWLEDIIPGRVFAVRGFGFSELHFVVSENGKELISIDAGTQPYSMEAAFKFLQKHRPGLPPLTTLLITHAHWDHVGGVTYLWELNPELKIYGRGNFEPVIARVLRNHTYKQFRGEGFKDEWVKQYRPSNVVHERTEITVGGTLFELVPVSGGETEDALLINMPKERVVFVGDVLMPFYGEPWVEEGFIDGAVGAMDEINRRKPKHIMHGHFGLTFMYGAEAVRTFRDGYKWLVEETRKHITNGYSVKDIVRLNLIPPGLQNHPKAFIAYVTPRDHIIARTADRMVGIWREDVTGQEPGGLDTLTSLEYGKLLDLYLHLSPGRIETGLRKMLDGGDNELALKFAVAACRRHPDNRTFIRLKEEAADRLRGMAQFLDPFKFVVYTELIGKEHKPVLAAPVR